MKNIFTILLFGILVCSCSSNQSKAEDLIKDYMFKNLNDYNSYEAIETKVDSCYTSIYTDSFIVKRADNILTFMLRNDELRKENEVHHNYIVNNAKYITLDGVYEKFSAASDASIKIGRLMIENNKIMLNEAEIIKKKVGEFVSTLNGWQVSHRFRCKSAGGTYAIHNYMFYFDNDITKITSVIDLEDIKNHRLIKIIDKVVEGKTRIIDTYLEDLDGGQ